MICKNRGGRIACIGLIHSTIIIDTSFVTADLTDQVAIRVVPTTEFTPPVDTLHVASTAIEIIHTHDPRGLAATIEADLARSRAIVIIDAGTAATIRNTGARLAPCSRRAVTIPHAHFTTASGDAEASFTQHTRGAIRVIDTQRFLVHTAPCIAALSEGAIAIIAAPIGRPATASKRKTAKEGKAAHIGGAVGILNARITQSLDGYTHAHLAAQKLAETIGIDRALASSTLRNTLPVDTGQAKTALEIIHAAVSYTHLTLPTTPYV